ncbi:hypothetical protein Mal64_22130 [Pseudobythopirellula maris]|uniref:Uncharacterized protein n=1 Tax=Pseudobythopirellula maris TaxID=2527991 RepID=A0A5C5ZNS0_9BACT|nr:PEP-CTERM sorting domain-containing protein [Pseudobythopirellula maris]TWT88725.1 hypothetical protein Mal64_22130 [Pseudobythopirellula maris]
MNNLNEFSSVSNEIKWFAVALLTLSYFTSAAQADSLLQFSGISDRSSAYRFYNQDAYNAPPGSVSLTYRQNGPDTDPNPYVGEYAIEIKDFVVEFAGDRLEIDKTDGHATIRDGWGCDCLYISFDYVGELAWQPFDSITISTDDDFSEGPGQSYDSDSLPVDGISLPQGTATRMTLYNGSDRTFFRIDQDSMTLTQLNVPEPNTMALASAIVLSLCVRRKRAQSTGVYR